MAIHLLQIAVAANVLSFPKLPIPFLFTYSLYLLLSDYPNVIISTRAYIIYIETPKCMPHISHYLKLIYVHGMDM